MARATLGTAIKKGDTIGGEFEVERKLGEGGCGTVFLCRWLKAKARTNTDKIVAVKVLDRSGDPQRFIREAQVLRKTKHPNVVRLLGSGYHEDRPYIALEYVEGGSVRDLMDKRRELPVEEAAWILVQTVRGLKASKTVHRDLKPENLLLTTGEGRTKTPRLIVNDIKQGAVVKVADFGLARDLELSETRLTNSGQVMGTPVYMSPEQCRSTKNVSIKTDIYAIGVLLYEMLSGKVPFEANNAYDTMKMHLEAEPTFPRIIPKDAKAVIRRCLEKPVGKRYPTLKALEKDLCALAGIGVERETGGNWGRVLVIVIIGVAILATLAWVLRDRLLGILPA